MPFKYKDCIEKGLLRKIPASKSNAQRSIERAGAWLKEAEKSLNGGAFDSSVLASYMTIFHSARATLFLDGYREKSHNCVARYLEEKYVNTGKVEKKWVELFDHYREMRHEDQYSVTFFATEEEARKAIESASQFLERMRKLIVT